MKESKMFVDIKEAAETAPYNNVVMRFFLDSDIWPAKIIGYVPDFKLADRTGVLEQE